MGWKWKSMGWIGTNTPSRRISNAKTHVSVAVRFNALPYSAQAAGITTKGMRGGGTEEGMRDGSERAATL